MPALSNLRRPRESLSLPEARRVALRGAGVRPSAPDRDVLKADLVRTVRALGLLQIDSVNVLVRSHYLPVFSRLGAYARTLLDRAAYGGPPAPAVRVLGSRSVAAAGRLASHCCAGGWSARGTATASGATSPDSAAITRAFCAEVLAEIRDRGPLGVSELSAGGAARPAGGTGAKARWRSSGCSGPGRSPRTFAATLRTGL